ncbi:MAG: CsbD family protein [Streptococcus gallolyticus]|nr:CsbD family protein [Streptococcus gallolyticus]
MSEKKYDAKLDQIKGNLKEGFGKVTGDKKLETEGLTEKTIAKGKELASNVKESAEGAVEGVKKAIHKDN